MEAQIEMPRYKCHKEVWALKIKSLDPKFPAEENTEWDGTYLLTPEEDGYAPFPVPNSYVDKHKPQVGGYYVVYADGYKSWSPADAFDGGYTRVN